jgi:hypothetical protein
MNSIPKPYLIIYLGFSTLLNILGLASIADGIIVWSGYIAEIIKVYHQFLRPDFIGYLIFLAGGVAEISRLGS